MVTHDLPNVINNPAPLFAPNPGVTVTPIPPGGAFELPFGTRRG